MIRIRSYLAAGGWLMTAWLPAAPALEPWSENPWYWARGGKPVLLIGGSDDDNLFQWPADQLVAQLDRLAAAGGNVVRNTMSDRRDKGFELYPFLQLDDGKYDLERWNPEYWKRFETFLLETRKRDIAVQIEVWDRFDYTDQRGSDRWQAHPYNPKNNVNYTDQESGFEERYPDHPGANNQPFFFTTPEQRDLTVVRRFQEKFVVELLRHTLPHDHVLYCIDNETNGEPEWAEFWTRFIKERAPAGGRPVMVTEMWDAWDLRSDEHRATFDHPELYDYVDVSQNNHNRGDGHWDNFLFVRNLLAEHPRPMNTTKTYGADGNKFGHSDQDGVERFWRHLLAGAASARFHRPDSGLGLGDKAVACLRAARIAENHTPFWELEPDNGLLGDRGPNEAYAAAAAGSGAATVFLPAGAGGGVSVKLPGAAAGGAAEIRWVDVDRGVAGPVEQAPAGGPVQLKCPTGGNWVACIRPAGAGD